MIDRLRRALEHVDQLPPDIQEQLAELIEEHAVLRTDHIEAHTPASSDTDAHLPTSVSDALAVAGAWSTLQGDDEFAVLDRMRHESEPSQPFDLDDL
ncbi:MAG: hypothetical protein ACHQ4H_09165 [Ktedonobacterales bacterium]